MELCWSQELEGNEEIEENGESWSFSEDFVGDMALLVAFETESHEG